MFIKAPSVGFFDISKMDYDFMEILVIEWISGVNVTVIGVSHLRGLDSFPYHAFGLLRFSGL
jgi:hypothetical protein